MAKIRLFWLASTVSALAFASIQGCGGDDDSGTTGSTTAGTGGTATGGKGGSSGSSTGGSSGKGGSGTAGKGGSSGTATAGGATSMGGETGAGGAGAYDPCPEYCELDEMKCPTAFADDYTDNAGCLTACADMPVGDEGASTGDSAECRIYHATAASGTDDTTHCPHASKDSAAGGCL